MTTALSAPSARLLLHVLLCTIFLAGSAGAARCITYPARLLHIIDGDTISVMAFFDQDIYAVKSVRLARIDAPEARQEGYQAAFEALRDLFAGEEEFTVTVCRHDKYGRWIGEVVVKRGNVSDLMLKTGTVREYR